MKRQPGLTHRGPPLTGACVLPIAGGSKPLDPTERLQLSSRAGVWLTSAELANSKTGFEAVGYYGSRWWTVPDGRWPGRRQD
jgi:hypothetical protein